MRILHRYLTFDKNRKLTRLLDSLAIRYKEQEKTFGEGAHFYSLEFFLYEDNPRFAELTSAVQPFGITPQVGTLFNKTDESCANWFIASTGQYQYPQPEDGYLEATFNLNNYCRLCDIGRVQSAPYRLKTAPKQHNSQFWGLHWHYEPLFVRQLAKNILEQEKIEGINFSQPVLHKNNAAVEDFYQLHIYNILDQGFDPYNSQITTCKPNNEENLNTGMDLPCCGRVKFHHPMRGGYLFNPIIFKTNNDIALSHEYFGSGSSANRLLFVSKRLKEIIDRHRLRGLSFIPVVHERLEPQ